MSPERKEGSETAFPSSVQFLVETHCFLRCTFCDQPCTEDSLIKSHLTKPLAEKLREEARLIRVVRRFPKEVKKVTLTGGDPTLVGNVRELLYTAKSRGLETSLATCWPGISYPKGCEHRFLPRVSPFLDVLKLSVHGGHKTHTEIVGVDNAAGLILALYEAKDLGIRTEVTMVVIEKNCQEVETVLELCLLTGVSRLTLSTVWPRGRGKNIVPVPIELVQEARKNLLMKRSKEIGNSGLTISIRKPEPACVLVYPTGRLDISHAFGENGLYDLGNLYRDDLLEAWANFPYREQFLANYRSVNE